MDRLVNTYVSAFYGWCRLTGADPQAMNKMSIYNKILFMARGGQEATPANPRAVNNCNHYAANLALNKIWQEARTNKKVEPLMPAVFAKTKK